MKEINKSMKCNQCGNENEKNAKFCEKCGASLLEMNLHKRCNQCGSENEKNAKFCEKCGASLLAINETEEEVKNEKSVYLNENNNSSGIATKKKKKWPIITGFCIAFLIFLGIIGGGIDPVETIKQGYLPSFSSTITIGNAFEKRFDACKWSSEESSLNDGAYNVYFTGYDPLTSTNWEVNFSLQELNEEDVMIEVDTVSIDGTLEYDSTVIYYLVDYVYTGNMDTLYTDLGIALWDSIFY